MKKYTDVDIIAELQKLVDSHVDSYKEDFDIDKRIIRRAAESQNPEDKPLMCSAVRMERTASMKIRSSFRGQGITTPSVSMRSRPTTSALPVSLSRKLSSAARCSGMSLRSTTGNRRQT